MIIKQWLCLILHKNICCGYSLESPRQGDSNEYPQHMFLWRTDKNYPSIIILLFCSSEFSTSTKRKGSWNMSLVSRKPVFGVFDQVRLKPVCSATEASESHEFATGDVILSKQRITKTLIRLCGCADWSAVLLFAYIKMVFSWCGSYEIAKCGQDKRQPA